MSLLTRFRFSLARMLVKAGSFSVVSPWVRASVLTPSFRSLVGDGYRKNAVVFACLSALAFDYPEPPIRVYADESPDAPALDGHPLRRLLRRPNPLMGEREASMYTIVYAGIGGNAYWHKVRNTRGQVVELWPYHAGQIAPVPGGDSWVKHYVFFEPDGSETIVPVEDIVHFKWPSPDPNQPWQAQPPLLAAASEVDADNEATRYLRALLANDAVPRTLVRQSADRIMTDDEVRRAKAQFQQSYGGDNVGGVLILEAGATVDRLGMNLQELAFDALHRVPEQRIAGALRVPLSVAGVGDDPTYANSEEAYRRYVRSTLAPLWALWGDEVQNSLADELGVIVRHDTSRVAVLQEDANEKATRVTAGFGAGLIGFYEGRGLLGLSRDPDPADLFAVSLGRDLLPFGQLRGGSATLVIPGETAPPKALPGPDARKASAERVARALRRVRARVAGRMEPRIAIFFDDLADQVVARAEDAGKALQQKDLPDVDQLLLPDDAAPLLALFRRFALEVVAASWEIWNGALEVDLAFDETDPAVVAALAQAGSRVRGIGEATRTALADLLQYGAAQGWELPDLIAGDDTRPGLGALIAQTYAGRHAAIARTELGTAQQIAATARYEAAGVARVRVLDNGQDDPDDACSQLNGTMQTLAWAKANLLGHPNCTRCFAPEVD